MFIKKTEEDIKNVIDSHQLWLSNKQQGKKADFSHCMLRDYDFSHKNLSEAIFTKSNLRGANFEHANLSGANFEYAHLSDANLNHANLTNANFKYSELENVNFDGCVTENTDFKYSTKYIEEMNVHKKRLSSNIGTAINFLKNSLTNTDERIQEDIETSKRIRTIVFLLFLLTIIILFRLPEELPDSLGQLKIIFYTFPILTLIIIATTLLRHDKKLINEIRYFSKMKHEIELYSGLLEASQHAANSFGDPEKAAKYVEDTFTLIRNKLLQTQIDKQQNDEKDDEIENEKVINIIDKLVNILGKTKSL